MKVYKQIKSTIPDRLKFPFWFLFKAPQRSVNRKSIFKDLWGLLIFIRFSIFPKTKLQPISICTGIYNRSNNYLSQLLESISKAENAHLIELSVVDCHSTDILNLEEQIRSKWNGRIQFTLMNEAFARSKTFNRAVKQATSPIVFICDADMWLPTNIVSLCNSFTGSKRVWYPIYFFLYKNRPPHVAPENGEWEQYGSKGMLACLKKDYEKIGGLNEVYTVWGHEDTDLWERFHAEGYTIIRNRQKNFFHHWHQSFNPKYTFMND